MSHGQPNRPQPEPEPNKYGDVFNVSGELASQPITSQDAAAEIQVLGRTHKGTPAEAMHSAATVNDTTCHQNLSDTGNHHGVSVTEAVGGQVLGHHDVDVPAVATDFGSAAIDGDPITIGEALEAVAISAGDKAVDQSDAAAITAAEIRATGENRVVAGGIGDAAQCAASLNTRATRREDMTKLSDVLTDATEKLATDKPVTKEDADAVFAAEVQFPWRRDTAAPEIVATPGGVAASMATAAQLNEEQGTN